VRRMKGGPAGSNLTRLSCITDDGIELWEKAISRYGLISSAEVVRIERRSVALDAVRPPRDLLVLDWWERALPAPIARAAPDHETVMELSGNTADAGRSIRTTRRHGPWQSAEETVSDVRRILRVMHDSARMQLDYAADEAGAPKRLVIGRSVPPPPGAEPPTSIPPKDLGRAETILGESCRWFDMMPGTIDGSHSACLTNDGIALKDETSGWGRTQTWSAARLARRPVGLDEVRPPAALLEPRLWGIE
jgi:hypothetical protein